MRLHLLLFSFHKSNCRMQFRHRISESGLIKLHKYTKHSRGSHIQRTIKFIQNHWIALCNLLIQIWWWAEQVGIRMNIEDVRIAEKNAHNLCSFKCTFWTKKPLFKVGKTFSFRFIEPPINSMSLLVTKIWLISD